MSDVYRIFETDQFLKDCKRLRISLGSNRYLKITEYVYRQLRENSFYGKNIKKLKDWKPETWRYRIGNYRLFYEINKNTKVISITAIDLRDKAY